MRLWQRLFLAFAVLSGAALFGFVLWQQHNFRSGFLGYLDAVALQRLEPARARLAAAYAEHGGWDFLRGDRDAFGELVEPRPPFGAFAAGTRPPFDGDEAARGPPRPFDEAPTPAAAPAPRPGARGLERGPRPPLRRGPPDLMPRLLLVDAAGTPVVGNPRVGADALSLPLQAGGQPIGWLRLARQSRIDAAIDVAFSHTQASHALVTGGVVLLGALAFAFALARWLLAPVRQIAQATRALAAGEFARRVEVARRDELGALAADFNRLAATLERHRDARRRWGADIAHELRTPLSVLYGEIQALQDGVRAPTPAALQSLHAECLRLNGLIEDLYQLALADAGALEYRFETLDFAALARGVLATHDHACRAAGLRLEGDVEDATPVRGDARRLAQLLDNLLANARRYTDPPGRIRVAVADIGGSVQLTVEDSPPGVPAASLPRLFDRLYRVDDSRARASGGTGLGLSICRAIVDAHGGSIDAQHSPLGGLRIVVRLAPAAAGAA